MERVTSHEGDTPDTPVPSQQESGKVTMSYTTIRMYGMTDLADLLNTNPSQIKTYWHGLEGFPPPNGYNRRGNQPLWDSERVEVAVKAVRQHLDNKYLRKR